MNRLTNLRILKTRGVGFVVVECWTVVHLKFHVELNSLLILYHAFVFVSFGHQFHTDGLGCRLKTPRHKILNIL